MRRPPSEHRFDIGPNDVRYPVDSGVPPQRVRRCATTTDVVAERFDRDVETDLVPELETIDDGFGGIIDTNPYPVDTMRFDASSKGRAGDANNTKGKVPTPRCSSVPLDRQPDLRRILRGEFVEAERREETNHTVRNARCYLEEGFALTQVGVRKRVDSTGATLDMPLAVKSREELGVEAAPAQVAGPDDPAFAKQRENALPP